MDRAQLASAIATVATLRGEFRLRSGAIATEYFDKYRFESDPTLLGALAQALAPLVPSAIDALAGLELGGIPLATALSLHTGLPGGLPAGSARKELTARCRTRPRAGRG